MLIRKERNNFLDCQKQTKARCFCFDIKGRLLW